MATVHSIVYQPEDREYTGEHSGAFIRVPAERVNLREGHGIEGDQKAGHHPDRQLNLISKEWLAKVASQGYHTAPGEFGEQIIIAGLAVETLQPGTRLQLGSQACVEVINSRTGCSRLEAAQGKSINGLGPLGVMVKVMTGGPVGLGDPVSVLEPVD